MQVAVAQIACVPGELETNLRKIESFAEQAKAAGAELVIFPELADTGYDLAKIGEAAQTRDEGAVPALRETAQRWSLAIICGVAERVGDTIYNSQVFIEADGAIAGCYRKAHLFCGETKCFAAGGELQSVARGAWNFGLTICYDLRFPEVYRSLATARDANVLVVSSAWPFPRAEHLRILAVARAIENQSYLLLANRVGTDAGLTFCGGSMIVGPAGEVLASAAAEGEDLISGELSPENLAAVRARMPVFADRRTDLYGGGTARQL